MLHPRPLPVSRPASHVLPSLLLGKKQLSPPVTIFRDQPSQSSPKPKAKATPQLLPQGKSKASCNAMPLRKLVPMGVWPQGFLYPLSKSMPQESLHIYIPQWGNHCPAREQYSQWYHLWKVTNPSPLHRSCLNKNVFSQLWSFSCVYSKNGKVRVCLNFFFKIFIYLFLERGEGRKRGRETSVCCCLLYNPYWGPGLQPRHVY